jgi:hypothetical protein
MLASRPDPTVVFVSGRRSAAIFPHEPHGARLDTNADDGSGTLQFSSSRAPGSWTNLPNATSPYTIQAGVAQQFFRLAE